MGYAGGYEPYYIGPKSYPLYVMGVYLDFMYTNNFVGLTRFSLDVAPIR